MPQAEKITALANTARQLHLIHSRGLVHRDLKPDNVVLVPTDPRRLSIVDFGMAIHMTSEVKGEGRLICSIDDYSDPHQARLVSSQSILKSPLSITQNSKNLVVFPGTPAYKSPQHYGAEAVAGADTWALGIMLLEILSEQTMILTTLRDPNIPGEAGIRKIVLDHHQSEMGKQNLIQTAVDKHPKLDEAFRKHAFWRPFLEQALHPQPNTRLSAGEFAERLKILICACLYPESEGQAKFEEYLKAPINLRKPEDMGKIESPQDLRRLRRLWKKHSISMRNSDKESDGNSCYALSGLLSKSIQNTLRKSI